MGYLNRPSVISTIGAATLAFLERPELFGISASPAAKTVIVGLAGSYFLDFVSVSIPGRIDDQVAKAISKENKVKKENQDIGETSVLKNSKEQEDETGMALAPSSGRTLVAPAGWAFAIWGPIFLGELVSVASTSFSLSASNPLLPIFQKILVPYVSANVFQSLWCASFREKYTQIKGGMYVSTLMLAGTAWSLGKVNAAITAASGSSIYSNAQYLMYFFPMSLHFGWTVAATLVNLNAAVALDEGSSKEKVALVGIGSTLLAASGGVALAISRGAPVFSGVISWALFAVADGMKKRIQNDSESRDEVGTYGAKWQLRVSNVGAWVCALVTAVVGYRVRF